MNLKKNQKKAFYCRAADKFKKTKKRFVLLERKLQFFGDIYRDFLLKRGLSKLKSVSIIRAKKMNGVKKDSVKLFRALWLMHPYCNYKCFYCRLHGDKPVKEEYYVKRSKEEYIRGWELFNQRYGPAKIEIVGGEPFIAPDFIDILAAISVKNSVFVVTNLSWDPKIVIGRIDPAKLSLLVSFHPDCEPSLEGFIEKIISLQSAGFSVRACIVAWPPYLPKLPSWLKEFYARGINVLAEPFMGDWKGRDYPLAYTAFEKEAIKNINSGTYIPLGLKDKESFRRGEMGSDAEINSATSFQFSNSSPNGKLCNAGVSYFSVHYYGDARRCIYGRSLGDFFKGNFSLLKEPESCRRDKCDCLGENLYIEGGMYGPQTTGNKVRDGG